MSVSVNLAEKIKEFQQVLDKWQFRNLTLYGKILTLKTFALSKLNHIVTCVEIPKDFANDVQDAIFNFIWDRYGQEC